MAINKRGSRAIVVDGTTYRWRVRKKVTKRLRYDGGDVVFAAEVPDAGGAILVASTGLFRDTFNLGFYEALTPVRVAAIIRDALRAGWDPRSPGKPFEMGDVVARN